MDEVSGQIYIAEGIRVAPSLEREFMRIPALDHRGLSREQNGKKEEEAPHSLFLRLPA